MQPDGKVHEGTALIIRNDIKHHEIGKFQREFLQVTSIIEDWNGCITTSAMKTSCYRTRQFSNLSGLTVFNCRLLQLEHRNITKISKQIS